MTTESLPGPGDIGGLSVSAACRVLRDYQAETVRLILAMRDGPGKRWARTVVLTPEATCGQHQATTPDIAVKRALGDLGGRPCPSDGARWALLSRETLLMASWHEDPEWLRRIADGSGAEGEHFKGYLTARRAARVKASGALAEAARRAAFGQEYGERVP